MVISEQINDILVVAEELGSMEGDHDSLIAMCQNAATALEAFNRLKELLKLKDKQPVYNMQSALIDAEIAALCKESEETDD